MEHALDYFCKVYNLKLGDLAILLKVKQPQINSWKKGSRNIPEKHLANLCDIFNVPEDRKYLFERSSLSDLEMSEIQIYVNKARLKNYIEATEDDEEKDEKIDKSILALLELNVQLSERNIEVLKVINKLKSELSNFIHMPDKFYPRMEKVEKLIEELKEE